MVFVWRTIKNSPPKCVKELFDGVLLSVWPTPPLTVMEFIEDYFRVYKFISMRGCQLIGFFHASFYSRCTASLLSLARAPRPRPHRPKLFTTWLTRAVSNRSTSYPPNTLPPFPSVYILRRFWLACGLYVYATMTGERALLADLGGTDPPRRGSTQGGGWRLLADKAFAGFVFSRLPDGH
jgi:hypothetical protein